MHYHNKKHLNYTHIMNKMIKKYFDIGIQERLLCIIYITQHLI